MNLIVKNRLASAVLVAVVAGIGSPAMHAAVIEEVVVTAQKRAESAQETPIAMTIVGSETIEKMGINNFKDVTKVSPSLTIREANNRNESPIFIRGIGTFSFSIGTEPSVAVVIDEVPVARTGAALTNLSDIERIEVLRGPQSTLFGKNASAGVVNITTKAPSEEWEGSVQVSATDDQEYRSTASVSGPLSDSLGMRLSGYYSDREGYIDNIGTGEKLHGSLESGARAKLLWDTDALIATFIAEYNESEEDCCALPFRSVAPGSMARGTVPDTEFLEGLNPSESNTQVNTNTPFVSDSRDWMASLKVDIPLGEYTLTNITGFRDWNYEWLIDLDNIQELSRQQGGPVNSELLTQELRLVSPASETFEYVAGLYYSNTENARSFQRGPTGLANWQTGADSELMAVFGQATTGLTDKLKLVTGLRFQNEEISVRFLNNLEGRSCEDGCSGRDDEDAVTGKLALQYFANDDVMVFASYSRGYKGQTYDITSSFSQENADEPVAAEKSNAVEVGTKTDLFDGRMQMNMSAFYAEYEDFQAQSAITDPFGDTVFKLNSVGELETKGLEADSVVLVGENIRFNIGLALIDAEIKSFEGANCWTRQTEAEGCVEIAPGVRGQDLSGKELANSPDLKATIGGDWNIPLSTMPFDGFANFSYQYQDDVNFDLLLNPNNVQEAYGVFNLSLGVTSNDADERYRVTFFVNNLFDQNYVTNIADNGSFTERTLIHAIPRDASRYMGVRLKLNF